MFVFLPPWRSNSQLLSLIVHIIIVNTHLKKLDSRIIEAHESSSKKKHETHSSKEVMCYSM